MASYYGYSRSTYAHFTDEAALRDLISQLVTDDIEGVSLWARADKNGKKIFAFGAYGSIDGVRTSSGADSGGEPEFDLFVQRLQELLVDGDVITITEVGHEKLNYLAAYAWVISKTQCEFLDLQQVSTQKAKAMAGPNGISAIDY